ncbi:methyltransferase domain-containing protein [Hyphomonas jannaschiana]|uniref:methyltransferase domain-containing protein n=1 Tax=Hyphomonas jannaschiana TaxID=86 RepID=UPI0035C70715
MTQPTSRPWYRVAAGVLPRPVRRRLLCLGRDLVSLPGRLKPGARPVPWSSLHDVGGGEFHTVGRAILNSLVNEAGLTPDDHVLDIGCGTGRVAFALADYLTTKGCYTGFDVAPGGLAWMIRHLPPAAAPFRIVRADVFNTEYRQKTETRAESYRFPVSDGSVDVAFATSVFTHLLPADAENYLAEIGRSLRPGGRAYVTAFLMTPERRGPAESGAAFVTFHPFGEVAHVGDLNVPEAMIAFDETVFMDWVAKAGLELVPPVKYGHWSGGGPKPGQEFQDVLVLRKTLHAAGAAPITSVREQDRLGFDG